LTSAGTAGDIERVAQDLVIADRVRPRRTSDILAWLADNPAKPTICVQDVVGNLQDRTYGFFLLVLSVFAFIPNIPGVSVVTGAVMMLVAGQLFLALPKPWLPGVVGRMTVRRATFARGVGWITPSLRRLERLSRPRLQIATSAAAERMVGLIVMALGFIIALPIPVVGNYPPAFAILALSLGLIERDGVVVLAGIAGGIVVVAVNWAFVKGMFDLALHWLT